jgi:hypothetical protein
MFWISTNYQSLVAADYTVDFTIGSGTFANERATASGAAFVVGP